MSSRPNLPAFETALGLTGIGLLASLPGGALAQAGADVALPEIDVSSDKPSPYRLDAQPAARLPIIVGETPQSITVVPREVIQERGVASVREALRNITGISLAAGKGGFSARGDFFIDGIRDLGQYTRDPFHLESVEAPKGLAERRPRHGRREPVRGRRRGAGAGHGDAHRRRCVTPPPRQRRVPAEATRP